MIHKIVAAVVLASFAAPLHAETARQPPGSETQITLSFAPVVKKAAPAVVNVYAQRVERAPRRSPRSTTRFSGAFSARACGQAGRPRNRSARA